jgi:peptide/nickel transport system permease protein
MGSLTWKALNNADMPILQAIFFVIALCVIVANFMSDLLYGVLDPRVKYG